MKHTHVFSKSLANIIITAMNKFVIGQPFHLQKDLALTKNQYNNFQKLRYWGLVKKHYNNEGIREGGYWELTEKTEDLINGGKIFKSIETFNNAAIGHGEDYVSLKDAYGYYDLPETWAKRASPVYYKEEHKQLAFI